MLRPSAAAGCSSLRACCCTAAGHPVRCCSADPAGSPARCRRWYTYPVPDCTAWGWCCSAHRSAADTPAGRRLWHSWSHNRRSGLQPAPQHLRWRCGRSANSSARTGGRADPWCSCTGSSHAAAAGSKAGRSAPDSCSDNRPGGLPATPSAHLRHSSRSGWACSWNLPARFPPPSGFPVLPPNSRSARQAGRCPPSAPAQRQALRPFSFCLPYMILSL